MTTKYRPGTLPDHDACTVHKTHMLGCRQFEQLIARSGQRCEICGAAGTAGHSGGKLHIDHDHDVSRWAVRGLLCGSCNSGLTRKVAKLRPAWAAGYLANAWWIKECERLGVPIGIAPEPDCGTVIIDQYEVAWLREGDGKWRPWGPRRPGISSAGWQWLYRVRGPHNMAPADLCVIPEGVSGTAWDWLVHRAERAALQALLSEHSGKTVPIYKTEAYGRLLVAYMGGEYEPRIGRGTSRHRARSA